MNLRTLIWRYTELYGEPPPFRTFGYRTALSFIEEQCLHCVLIEGDSANPNLTLMIPATPEHVECLRHQSANALASMEEEDDASEIEDGARGGRDVDVRPNCMLELCSCRLHLRLVAILDNAPLVDKRKLSRKKRSPLETLKDNIHAIIKDSKRGVWCKDLMNLYRERYGNVPELARFGFTTIVGLVQSMSERLRITRYPSRNDMWLQDVASTARPPTPDSPSILQTEAAARYAEMRDALDEDALPYVPYAPDVYPADCLQLDESVPSADISLLHSGVILDVVIGEVYSPSHLWLIRLGPEHETPMTELIQDMTYYFENGDGRNRFLATAALRVGQYCVAFYDCNWHRAIIIDLLAGENQVRVRYVDFGTVENIPASSLRPFLRRWASVPMQAVRARQAIVRPTANGQHWSPAAIAYFQHLVHNRMLTAHVVAVDYHTATIEVFLADTGRPGSSNIARIFIESGFAEERPNSALHSNDSYLYPAFSVLENGITASYSQVQLFVPASFSTLEPTLAPGPGEITPPLPQTTTSSPSTSGTQLTATAATRQTTATATRATSTLSSQPSTSPGTRATASVSGLAATASVSGLAVTPASTATPTIKQTPKPSTRPKPAPLPTTTSTSIPTTSRPTTSATTIFRPRAIPANWLNAASAPGSSLAPWATVTSASRSISAPDLLPPATPAIMQSGQLSAPGMSFHGPSFNMNPLQQPMHEMIPQYASMPEGYEAGAEGVARTGDLLTRSAVDWAMYEYLSATAYWYKMAAIRRAQLAVSAAAAADTPSDTTPPSHLPSDPLTPDPQPKL